MDDIKLTAESDEDRAERSARIAAKKAEEKAAAIAAVDIGQHWRITDDAKARCPGWPDEVVVVENNDYYGGAYVTCRVLRPLKGKGTSSPKGAIVLHQDYELIYDPNRSDEIRCDDAFDSIRQKVDEALISIVPPD